MTAKHIQAEFPSALQFLFKPHRFKVARGGRGSGKSWSFARALILRCFDRTTRVLCTREIQKSIQQSVHQLLSDQIGVLGLSAHFEILNTEIRCTRTGSEIYFSGLSSETATSLKSFEGVDICWCEEAQNITSKSWEILIPTIRKDGSEIWVSYNPELETDATHQRFVINPPEDCVSVLMNYHDNPWFPEVLEKERLHCLASNPEGYKNIWDGQCLPAVSGAIYYNEITRVEQEGRVQNVPYDPMLKVHAIFDLGWNDCMTVIFAQRSASELRVIDYIEDSHRTLDEYAKQIKDKNYNLGVIYLPHDGFSRDYKTGKSACEILQALGFTVEQTPNIEIESGIRAARMAFSRMYFDKTKAARLIECLKRYRRRISAQTQEAGTPLHDEFSHGADAFRYLSIVVDGMSNDSGTIKPIKYALTRRT
jgi:phage terminase large subunit